jgi:hypothetical protein
MAQLPAGLIPRRWKNAETRKPPTQAEILSGREGPPTELDIAERGVDLNSPEMVEGRRIQARQLAREQEAEWKLYNARREAREKAEQERADALYASYRSR